MNRRDAEATLKEGNIGSNNRYLTRYSATRRQYRLSVRNGKTWSILHLKIKGKNDTTTTTFTINGTKRNNFSDLIELLEDINTGHWAGFNGIGNCVPVRSRSSQRQKVSVARCMKSIKFNDVCHVAASHQWWEESISARHLCWEVCLIIQCSYQSDRGLLHDAASKVSEIGWVSIGFTYFYV